MAISRFGQYFEVGVTDPGTQRHALRRRRVSAVHSLRGRLSFGASKNVLHDKGTIFIVLLLFFLFLFWNVGQVLCPPPPTDLLHFPKHFVKRCFILMSTFEQEIFASIFSKRNGRQHGVYRLPVGPF